ncbi:MAG: transporter substrate-binding domain-containing protein [Treponema sp.]|nr:transporter substrate-binding domain-containing protein [Treponema sp.]
MKIIKTFTKIMTLLTVVLLSQSCSKAKKGEEIQYNGKKEYAEAAQQVKGKLRVGMECAYAPFNWTQSSKDVKADGWQAVPIYGTPDYAFGYDIMFSKMLADEMGLELEVHKVQWSSIVLGLKSGDYDVIIAGMIYTKDRDKTLDFTRAYYNRDNVMVIKKGSSLASATTLADFKGCKATTQINTAWSAYVEEIPDVTIIPYPETTAEVVMQVAMGSADCAVLDYPTGYSATLSNPDVSIVRFVQGKGFVTPPDCSEAVSVAVDEGNTVLKDAVGKAMDAISWDQAKMNKYMDLAITTQPLSN